MKAFKGGLFGCLGVGAAVLVVALVIIAIGSAGRHSSGTGSSPAPAGTKVLLDVSGNGQKTTPKFQAPGDWTIEYSYDCSGFGTEGNFILTVQGDTFDVAANQIGAKGSDTASLHSGGSVYLTISSECAWHVTAKG